MALPTFYKQSTSLTLANIAASTKARLVDASRADHVITGVASLDEAGPHHLTFFENVRYADQLARTHAGAVLISETYKGEIPAHVAVLRAKRPFAAFVELTCELQPDALWPASGFDVSGISEQAIIHPTAVLEDDVTVDPLAVIGPDVEIGSGTLIGSGAVIAAGVKIGRDCNIGAGSVLQFTLIGNNVLVHPGCKFGQDGFGFVFGRDKHIKVPQTGRVLIQNDVEVGAGTTIDRGSLRDTVIGEGTKIDNQVQIGHNVTIGRHCVIAAKCGLAGSLTIGDNVALGAMVGLNNHITIGDGAQVTAMSGVKDSIPPRGRWGGVFAKPTKQWFRELLALERLGRESAPGADTDRQNTKDERE